MEKQVKNLFKQLKLSESTISTILGALVVVIVGALIFNYFKQASQPADEITSEAANDEQIVFEENEMGETVPVNLPKNHIVVPGEDLWQISEKYYNSGYNWVDIAQANNLVNPDLIAEGQELILPQVAVKTPAGQAGQVAMAQTASDQQADQASITGSTYTVAEGDSLWKIAVRAYSDGYKWPEIANANNLVNADLLEVGEELKLPR